VLLTNPGERVNLPEFGVGIQRLVFAPNSESLRASTQFLVTTNLRRWLGDKIDVERVDVSSFIGEEETVTIEIVFVEKRTRERRSLQLQV
jgi:phage baseplate assembly protein W